MTKYRVVVRFYHPAAMRSEDTERSERLRSVDLASGLDRVALARLAAYMTPLAFAAGELLCAEGDAADALFIVVRGRFSVHVGRDGAVLVCSTRFRASTALAASSNAQSS